MDKIELDSAGLFTGSVLYLNMTMKVWLGCHLANKVRCHVCICKLPYVEQTRKKSMRQRVRLDNYHLEETSIYFNIWYLVLRRKTHQRQGNSKSNNKNRYNLLRVCYNPAEVLIALPWSNSSTNIISSSFPRSRKLRLKCVQWCGSEFVGNWTQHSLLPKVALSTWRAQVHC